MNIRMGIASLIFAASAGINVAAESYGWATWSALGSITTAMWVKN